MTEMFAWDDRMISVKFSVDVNGYGQGIKRRYRNIAENFNRLSRVQERYKRQTGDRRQTYRRTGDSI